MISVNNYKCGVARTGLALAVAALLSSPAAWASGYNFGTQSASGQGTAHANGAEADDASVIYDNPAGLTRLKGFQASQVLNVVLPAVEFTQTGPATARLGASPVPISGNNGGDPVDTTVVPHGYLSYQINDRFTAGLGVYVPFGANVSYDHQFVGRYYGTDTLLRTININPSLGFKLDDKQSLGFGLDVQHMKAKLARMQYGPAVYYALTHGVVNLAAPDGRFSVEGDSWGVGYNLGYLLELDAHTRFGAAYRSSIRHNNKGTATLDASATMGVTAIRTADATAELRTPESLSLNAYRDLDSRWALMADLTWTRHSRLDQVVVKAQPVTTTYYQTNWKDTLKAAVGASYQLNDQWKLRGGYSYDQSPSGSDADVLPTMPDNDRQWLSVGANWKLDAKNSLDFAYSYIFIRDRTVNRSYDSPTTPDMPLGNATSNLTTGGTSNGTVQGVFRSHAQILGVQLNHQF